MRAAHRRALLLACAGVLGWAAPASADTFCVQDPTCTGTPADSLPAAIAAASGTDGLDRIQLGPGRFPYAGESFANETNPVQIVGAGRGVTVLDGSPQPSTRTIALRAGSSVSDLTVQIANTPPGLSVILLVGASAERVDVEGPDAEVGTTAVDLRDGASYITGKVTLPPSKVQLSGVVAVHVGKNASDAPSTLSDLDLQASRALYVDGGTVVGQRLLLSSGSIALRMLGGRLTLGSSVLRTAGSGVAAAVADPAANLTLVNATVLSSSGGVGATVDAGVTAISNSVFSGFDRDIATKRGARVTVDHSRLSASPGSAVRLGAANLLGPLPAFKDLAQNDLQPAPDSPLVDCGAANPAAGPTDLLGAPRQAGQAVDIGAVESPNARTTPCPVRQACAEAFRASTRPVPVLRGTAYVRVNYAAPSPARCQAILQLSTADGQLIGRRTFTGQARKTARVRIKLTAAGRRALRAAPRRLRARLQVSPVGLPATAGSIATQTVRLTPEHGLQGGRRRVAAAAV